VLQGLRIFREDRAMQPKLEVLRLFLEALDVPPTIDTVNERKRVQKAVYLGQLSGVDLGYRFGWYIMGPYSTSLTQDYYQLAEALATSGTPTTKNFRPNVEEKLKAITPLLVVPAGVDLSREDWLELLASYDYLRRVSEYTHEQALERLKNQKSHVVAYVDQAVRALSDYGLLKAA